MYNEKSIKEAKVMMTVSLIVGIILLTAGFVFRQLDINLIDNNKALPALSLLPFSMAFVSFLKLSRISKSPQQMKSILLKENDERLVALRHEADAKTFKIIQGALFLTYFGYTFMFPEEIFKSAGWWVLVVMLLGSMFLQSVFRHQLCKNPSND